MNVLKRDKADVHALLLWDNAPCHPSELQSGGGQITTKFLPKNTTAILQPADQGQIAAFKAKYRRLQITHCLDKNLLLDESVQDDRALNSLQNIKDFNIKDAIFIMQTAWSAVSADSLKNCWKHLLDLNEETIAPHIVTDDHFPNICSNEQMEEWLSCDEHETGVPSYGIQDIIDEELTSSDNEETCEADQDPPHQSKMSRADKLQLLQLLDMLVQDLDTQNSSDTWDVYSSAQKVRIHTIESLTTGLKQLKMTDFAQSSNSCEVFCEFPQDGVTENVKFLEDDNIQSADEQETFGEIAENVLFEEVEYLEDGEIQKNVDISYQNECFSDENSKINYMYNGNNENEDLL